jgi:hypothetical protein
MFKLQRKTLAVVGVATLCAAGLTMAALPAHAVGSSTFEITDGDLVVNHGGIDWASVTQVNKADKPTGQNDDSFGNGTKEDTPVPQIVSGSIPNNKSDLKNFGTYLETTASGQRFLNVYWTRVQEPTGTTNMDFEFNQSSTLSANGVTPVRTAGDVLIMYDLSQGGTNPTLWLSRWVASGPGSQCEANNTTPCWGTRQNLSASGDAAGSINTAAILAGNSDGLGALSARTFGEAQINFDALTGGTAHCISFGSAYLKSRSSDSFTAAAKDFIAPAPEQLSNCATVIIRKQTSPADPSETQFGYTKAFSTDPATANTFTLGDGQNKTYTNVLPGTGYTVDETTVASGWDFEHVDCSASTGVTPTINGSLVTFAIDSSSDVLDCTYTNRARAALHVVKVAERDGVNFTFNSNTLSPATWQLANGQHRDFTNLAPGGYDVSETVPANWSQSSATCDNGNDPSAITLHAGDDVTCTFTNVINRGALLIHKVYKHAADGPGNHPQSGVSFHVTNGNGTNSTVTTDANGDACVPNLPVSALDGDYSVTETLPAGYHNATLTKSYTVVAGTTCATATPVQFVNIPLTNLSMSVDSQVNGGTSSTITCSDGTNTIASGNTAANGDGSASASDLEPGTYTCTVVIDP